MQLATIQAEKEAKIAAAKAMGEALAKANLNFYGDPNAMQQITGAFFRGQALGSFTNGLSGSLSPMVTELVNKLVGTIPGDEAKTSSAPADESKAGTAT